MNTWGVNKMPLTQETIKEKMEILKMESQAMRQSIDRKLDMMNELHSEIMEVKKILNSIDEVYCDFELQLKE